MGVRGMSMIFIALAFLVIPGVMYNNLNNTGLAPAQTLTCPGWPDVTCQGSVSAGCQVNSAYCTLSSQTVSFLSGTSPFTQLIQGNVLALFNQVTTNNAAVGHGPFDTVGSPSYLIANCIVSPVGSKSLNGWQFDICTQSNPDGSNMTKANAATMNSWNTGYIAAATTPFYNLMHHNATDNTFLTCNWNAQINYTYASTPYAGYTWYGCDYGTAITVPATIASLKAHTYYSLLISVPWQNGALTGAGTACSYDVTNCWHVQVPIQLENWETESCITTQSQPGRTTLSFLISPQCDQWFSTFKQQTQSTSATFGILTPLVTFIVGLAFFFLGLGLNFSAGGSVLGSGTTFGLGSNRQGTKLMQVLGIGLVIWSVLYSEFSTWFTTGLLPYGFDGSTGIISLLLTGLFFFGVYDQATAA